MLPVIAKVSAYPPYDEDASGEDVPLLEHVQRRQLFGLLSFLVGRNLIKDGVDLIDLLKGELPLVLLGDIKQHVLGLALFVVLSKPPHFWGIKTVSK